MINLIVDVSKYLMMLLMAVHTYLNFRLFGVGGEKKGRICGRQNMVMFFNHLLAYVIICLMTEDMKMLVSYRAQVVFFLCYIYLSWLFYRNISRLLPNNMYMLLSVGFITLTRFNFDRAVRQFVIVVVAALVIWVTPFIIDRAWQLSKIPWVYGILRLLLLAVVYVAGNSSCGAQLSLSIGGISFQPSESVKITFAFFVATMLYRPTGLKTVLVTMAVATLHVLILVLPKDLGSALIFFITYLFMLFVAIFNWFYLGARAVEGCAASVLVCQLFSHVRARVAVWQNPWADTNNRGYQITQSLFAIGTGGWFGMGPYQGMPRRIPAVEKDFVFAAISEEMGGIFALCALLVCLSYFLQFTMIASRMQASFFKLLAFGLGVAYVVQVILTVGGVIKFIPPMEVTLPFVSYDGSSTLATFVIFKVVQGLFILKRNKEEEDV